MPTPRKKAKKDANQIPTLIGVSNQTTTVEGEDFVQDETPVNIAVNPTTGAVVLEAA